MSASSPEGDRNVIPFWRNPQNTSPQELASTLSTTKPLDDSARLEHEQDWLAHRTLGFALDLIGSGVVLGASPSVHEAAEFVLEAPGSPEPAKELARRVLGRVESRDGSPLFDPTPFEARQQIHSLRLKLRNDPRNALAWTEMARFYTILGQRDQAGYAMGMALALAPNSRYVLRAASRLAVHHGQFEDAHSIVSRAALTPSDPWLVATELATSGPAGKRPRLVKHGRRMLEGKSFPARATTELASALGTLEVRAGADRKARRLFEASLQEPNDNAIAQGEWISHVLPSVAVDQALLQESAEARAIRYGNAMESEKALEAAWEWHRDQPFASGPGELGSYHASLAGAYREGAAIAESVLTANPGEFLLANNLAFCLLNLDETERAQEVLASINLAELSGEQYSTYLATYGLLEYRAGNPAVGRELYRRSIETTRDSRHQAVAKIMLASEELRLHSPEASKMLQEAFAASREVTADDIRMWLKRLPSASS